MCQLKKARKMSAEPTNTGIEKSRRGDPACGRMVPHLAKELIHTPSPPPNISGKVKPSATPMMRAVIHFMSSEHP